MFEKQRNPIWTIPVLLIKSFILWMFLFFLQRTTFLLYFLNQTPFSFSEYLQSNYHALGLDISASCYFLFIPAVLVNAMLFVDRKFLRKIYNIYYYTIIIFASLLLASDLGLFSEWGSKINRKALSYLVYGGEALGSALSTPIWLYLIITTILSAIGIWIFKKWLLLKTPINKVHVVYKLIYTPVIFFLLFTGARGGLQTFPINKNPCYFSTNAMLNLATVNSSWNFFNAAFSKEEVVAKQYKYFEKEKCEKIFSQHFSTPVDTTLKIFSIDKPNFVVILLESWSAEICGFYGNQEELTPCFDSLAHEGLAFKNFYSTGFRTEQAMAALISGFPSQPTTTIIRKFGKFEHLPSLFASIKTAGYHTSYFCGGDVKFANTDAYLNSMKIDKITGEKQLPPGERTLYGLMDDLMFRHYIKDIQTLPQPFFSMCITCTSHEPFEAKVKTLYSPDATSNRYKNTVHYTDQALGKFIKESKKQPWFKNTVFIVLADHAHRWPNNRKIHEVERHWIPFVIFGEPLKKEYAASQFSRFSMHSDFPAMILSQLNIPYRNFKYSKNPFNPYSPDFAFYTFDDGFGLLSPESMIVFDNKRKALIINKNNKFSEKEENLSFGKAILQKMMTEYIEFNN